MCSLFKMIKLITLLFKMIVLIFHDRHFKFYESVEADLSCEMKKRFLMLNCVHLGLASQKERRQHLIILHVWIIIFSEFLLFYFHSSC